MAAVASGIQMERLSQTVLASNGSKDQWQGQALVKLRDKGFKDLEWITPIETSSYGQPTRALSLLVRDLAHG